MVPVPEELAPAVLNYVSWKGVPRPAATDDEARGEAGVLDGVVAAEDEPIARGLDALDGPGRALVRVIATANLDGQQLTIPQAAARAGITTREAVSITLEFNSVVASVGGPPIAIFAKDLEPPATDRFSWSTRTFLMTEQVARPVADLSRARAEG